MASDLNRFNTYKRENKPSFDAQMRKAIDLVSLRNLRFVLPGIAVLYLVFMLSHLVVLQPPVSVIMASVAGVSSVLFAGLYLILKFRRPANDWAQPLGFGFGVVILINSLLHLLLTGEPWQTTNVMVLMVGMSFLLLDTRWFVAVMFMTIVGWWGVVQYLGESPLWTHFWFAMLSTLTLSVLVHFALRRTYAHFEALRVADRLKTWELERRTVQLETSIEVGRYIAEWPELADLLKQVVELVQGRYGAYFVGVFLADGEQGRLAIRAGTGEPGRVLMARGFSVGAGDGGLIGWVAENREALWVEDVAKDSRYRSVEPIADIRSEVVLPLIVRQELIGVLDMQSDRVGGFSRDEMPVLQLMADHVAVAIQNTYLYQGVRSDRDLAQMLLRIGRVLTGSLELDVVLDLILKHLAQMVEFDRVALLVEEGGELVGVRIAGFPAGTEPSQLRIPINIEDEPSFYAQIYHKQVPMVIENVSKHDEWRNANASALAQVWMGVPLMRTGSVMGMLSLVRVSPTPFTETEITVAGAFADQAGIALSNAQLYEDLTRFNQELEIQVKERTRFLRDALDQLERLDKTKSDFISIASHELRTPLTIVDGYGQMLFEDQTLIENSYRRQLITGIRSGTKRMEEIVSSMLDIAKIENEVLQVFPKLLSIDEVMERVTRTFFTAVMERNLSLDVAGLASLPLIEADPALLYKVLFHLVANGIKYTPNGGKIRVSGRVIESTPVLSGSGVEISIRDSGIGISPDLQEVIFEKFYQTGDVTVHSTGTTKFKGGGPGLGLAIVRGIVSAHGGKVWVESAGHDEAACWGSTFYVLLPIKAEEARVIGKLVK